MKKMILTAIVVLGLAAVGQQTATAGIFVRVAPRPVYYSPHYVCAAPICPAPAVVYAPAPAPVCYAPAPAVVVHAPVVVVSVPLVRIHLGHLHVWF